MDTKTAFNEDFSRIFQPLDLFSWSDVSSEANFNLKITDKFDHILNPYRDVYVLYSMCYKEKCNITSHFSFNTISIDNLKNVIKELEIISQLLAIFQWKYKNKISSVIEHWLNLWITLYVQVHFSIFRGMSTWLQFFKYKSSFHKSSYRSIRILPLLSKLDEKSTYSPLFDYGEAGHADVLW